MESHKSTIVIVLLAWLVGACGGEESRWAGTITDSAGVTMVSNPAEGIWTEAERWTVEEELRIGVVEGDPKYQFGDVGGIAVDSRGRIVVLDIQAQHIKVFSPEGEYEQTIGGPGGGPGELADAYLAPVVTRGDTLLVADIRGNRRVNRYSPDGSRLGSYRIPFEGYLFPILSRPTPSGQIAVQVRPFPVSNQPEPEMVDRILVLSPSGTDELLKFRSGQTVRFRPSFELAPYAPEPVWDIAEDGRIMLGMNDQYRIGVYASGKLERVIEKKPCELMPLKDAEDFYLALLTPDNREYMRFGEFYPAFNDIIAGPHGTIWVQHVRTVSELSDAERESWKPIYIVQRQPAHLRKLHGAPDWDVFDAEGRYLGVVSMPDRFAPKIFRGDKIYGLWRDDLNVDYVVRLRIRGDLGVGAT